MNDAPPGFGEVALFGAISSIVLWLGFRGGFFRSCANGDWKPNLSVLHVVIGFGIYFGASIVLPALLAPALKSLTTPDAHPIAFVAWLNLFLSAGIFGGLLILGKSMPEKTSSQIWRSSSARQPYADDVKYAIYAWVISFPVVLFASQLFDYLVFALFHVTQLPDQLAVYFVKMSFAHPVYFALALVSIVILAPLIEEILFRGLLQSFIRQQLGSTSAIAITSLCFAFFHFSPEQGLGNIPIIGSLFSLALFLGYLYERQGSLFAPIALHSIFNAMSILNLYFLGEVPRGAL